MINFWRKKCLTNERGAALLLFMIFFLFASVGVAFVIGRGVLGSLVEYALLYDSKSAHYAADASAEDVAYRIIQNFTFSPVETLTYHGALATTTATFDGFTESYTIESTGTDNDASRQSWLHLIITNGVTFSYGMQSGNGGIEMKNSSSILGNVLANGPITGAGNTINGDVISAGLNGLIDDIHATGSAWAYDIANSYIEIDAYYDVQGGANTVDGSRYAYSPTNYQATATFPISDDIITIWKTEASASGTYSGACPYVIDASMTLPSQHIPCDLTISKNGTTVTLEGPVWVEGNFTTLNGPTIEIDSSLADTIVPIIADNPADRVTSSKVDINNSTEFVGAAGVSHVLVISLNEDDEVNGGSEVALVAGQSGSGDLILYAPHGRAVVGNSGNFTELTAYTIELQNSVEVIFDTGLINPNFTGGPAVSFVIDDWIEI